MTLFLLFGTNMKILDYQNRIKVSINFFFFIGIIMNEEKDKMTTKKNNFVTLREENCIY
jgi:hypothetical protein